MSSSPYKAYRYGALEIQSQLQFSYVMQSHPYSSDAPDVHPSIEKVSGNMQCCSCQHVRDDADVTVFGIESL